MKTVPSLLLPGVEPREPTDAQLLARKAYQNGELPSAKRRPRKVVSKETAKENSRIMQQRLDSFVAVIGV